MANELNLKKDLKIVETEEAFVIENLYEVSKKMGKITSRATPVLLGMNNFQSVGHGILDRIGALEFGSIDPIYTVRGAIGEELVRQFLLNAYEKKGIKAILKTFKSRYKGSNGVWYGNDNFKDNPKFGGVIDIGIQAPIESRAVVEVKSKGEDSWDYIFREGKEPTPPNEEVWQGKHLTALMKLEKLLMVYIKFNKNQMEMLRFVVNDKDFDVDMLNEDAYVNKIIKEYSFKFQDFEIKPIPFKVAPTEVIAEMDKAYEIVKQCYDTKTIPKKYLSKENIDTLRAYSLGITDDSLPF